MHQRLHALSGRLSSTPHADSRGQRRDEIMIQSWQRATITVGPLLFFIHIKVDTSVDGET